MTGESQADRASDSKPSLLFDPAAGLRAVADIQAEGLRAASALLERMLGAEHVENGHRSAPAGDYAALVDAWTDLIRAFVGGLTQAGQPGAMTASLEANGVGRPVRLAREPTHTEDMTAEVWLHNGTASRVGPLIFRCSDLSDAEGRVLAGAEVRFDPATMEPLPARSSRAVVVSLVTTDWPRPGIYRGTIQAQGAPGLWLPLEVAIAPC